MNAFHLDHKTELKEFQTVFCAVPIVKIAVGITSELAGPKLEDFKKNSYKLERALRKMPTVGQCSCFVSRVTGNNVLRPRLHTNQS